MNDLDPETLADIKASIASLERGDHWFTIEEIDARRAARRADPEWLRQMKGSLAELEAGGRPKPWRQVRSAAAKENP